MCCPESTKRVAINERVLITTLTKRMAEDLTNICMSTCVRVRYLHAEYRDSGAHGDHPDLRLGKFDVLVESTCCVKGLTCRGVAGCDSRCDRKVPAVGQLAHPRRSGARRATSMAGRSCTPTSHRVGWSGAGGNQPPPAPAGRVQPGAWHSLRGESRSRWRTSWKARARPRPMPGGRKRGGKGETPAPRTCGRRLRRQIKKLRAEMFSAPVSGFEHGGQAARRIDRLSSWNWDFRRPTRSLNPGNRGQKRPPADKTAEAQPRHEFGGATPLCP